jgi:hypothetical protein
VRSPGASKALRREDLQPWAAGAEAWSDAVMATGRSADIWRRSVVPHTRIGRWCVGSFGVGLVALALMALSIGSGQRGGDTLADNWWISGPALVAALGFVGAFAIGSIAVVRVHERAVTVFAVTAFGAFVTLYLVAEVTNPH